MALLLAAAPVLADSDLGHKGKFGQHSLNEAPSLVCVYNTSDLLTSFEVTAPTVYARNTTSARDRGKVGWRFLIKRDDGSTETTLYRSAIWKATAYDNTPAVFSNKTAAPAIPSDAVSPGSQFTVVIKMFWYAADGRRIGVATHAGEFYTERAHDGSEYDIYPCYWHLI